jgi:predicted DNA repair protein MutK
MSGGLLALLDDVAAIAKAAAASLDDVAAQATNAGGKAAGVVIDDAAVTPRYVTGLAAARELPIIRRIALGSLRNKLIYLLPAALLLSAFAPFAITPLLILGGLYLCAEGAGKLLEGVLPHAAPAADRAPAPADAAALEAAKISSAIRTDFILSAEIMAITLAAVEGSTLAMQAMVLAVVGIGITLAVYGAVALIVKADDAGLALAGPSRPAALQALGRGIVAAMPRFLRGLAAIGTAAMLWVGGGIVLHGAEALGFSGPAHRLHHLAELAAHAIPAAPGAMGWIIGAVGAGVVGLALGGVLALVHAALSAWRR